MDRSGKCRCFAFSVQMVGEVYAHTNTDICYLLASLLRILHRFDWLCLPQTRLDIIHTSMASALAAPSVMILS